MSNSSAHIVVCGAGVIGAATAYFLTRRGARVTIIEQDRPACAASGKAGGFLALDWCDDTALQALARRSFALHAELAANLPDDYGYRRLQTWAATAHASA
ncbi:MAG: FAD-binding oxidoreductase, partial [Candidatus Competibacteraceae bacterium]|nr:FAD-binding oxidoreductase [Candidatus Competibacteraceae bacterium]